MKTRAAVLHDVGDIWHIETIDLDPPKAGEVLVKWMAAGLCHSDDHLATGDMATSNAFADARGLPRQFPLIGGHEGAGLVVEVGDGVTTLAPGDHVCGTYASPCGRCRYCTTGRTFLCDNTEFLFQPGQLTDGTSRHWLDGQPLSFYAKLGCFAEHSVVAEASLVKVPEHVDLELAALISCGVLTGWGSGAERAGTTPGDTVVVMGVGGVGIHAVQGARSAGAAHIVAVDPSDWKRKTAYDFGATHDAPSMREAMPIVRELTNGRMADRIICIPGVMKGEYMKEAIDLIGKGGVCVVTGVAAATDRTVAVSLQHLAMFHKEIRGCLNGGQNPRVDIERMLRLHAAGQLKLDGLITQRYSLDEINQGYDDLKADKNLRGVLVLG